MSDETKDEAVAPTEDAPTPDEVSSADEAGASAAKHVAAAPVAEASASAASVGVSAASGSVATEAATSAAEGERSSVPVAAVPPAGSPPPWWSRWVTGLAGVVLVLAALWVGMLIGPAEEPAETAAEPERQIWTCSMHPQIRMPEPGQCPICGMDLIPAAGGSTAEGDEALDRVTLSPRARAMASVRTEPVRRTEPRTDVRLLGQVDYDETRLRMITPWTAGRVERLKVRVTGAKISRGQLVATLYSPEVYAAMRDLIVAAEQAKKLAGGLPGSASLATRTVEATRERLRLLGVPDSLIAEIERDGKAPKNVQLRSPYAGTVLERKVEEGDYVQAGTVLFHIADLSKVWVQIDAYESDLPLLSPGQKVELLVESLPDEVFEGEVAFIDPVIDPAARTAKVRVEVDNADGQLRPGMFAQARIQGRVAGESSHLVIPASAPLFTGRRSVVYVEVPGEPGTYALREVRLGPRAGPVYPVLAGLAEGERVVVEGAFLVDADLQLRGGRSMMTLPDDDADRVPLLVVPPEMLAALEPVLEPYLDAHASLAADRIDEAREQLGTLATAASEVEAIGPKQTREAWSELASSLSGHARHGATAKDAAAVRVAFEALGNEIATLLERFGNPTAGKLDVAFCPMAFDSKGAQWVQRDEPLANPYYGAAMLRCGEVKATLAPGERLAGGSGVDAAPAGRGGHHHG
ncbi:MAG: efflux RND transporter periplasmic adaptor subunit [Myxococcales bacterium]|nr:efflux RND transporter periplasmic adaptor subunit [Myxococcales bacterium]